MSFHIDGKRLPNFYQQFTLDAIRTSYRKNAMQLAQLAARAEAIGRNVNGHTAEYWRKVADQASYNADHIQQD